MSRITELQEAINKFTEETGVRPLRLRIRKDIVEEMESEIFMKTGGLFDPKEEKKRIEKKGPHFSTFNGIPFITDEGFPHGIVRWRIEVVIDGELYYHAKVDPSPIPDGTITIDLKTSIME